MLIAPVTPETMSEDSCVVLSAMGRGVVLSNGVGGVPAWDTVTIWPPWIMMVPLRAGPGLAANV